MSHHPDCPQIDLEMYGECLVCYIARQTYKEGYVNGYNEGYEAAKKELSW